MQDPTLGGILGPRPKRPPAPELSEDERAVVELFELDDDEPFDPCPDCGLDPNDSTLHADGCRRILPGWDLRQFGPPWLPWSTS